MESLDPPSVEAIHARLLEEFSNISRNSGLVFTNAARNFVARQLKIEATLVASESTQEIAALERRVFVVIQLAIHEVIDELYQSGQRRVSGITATSAIHNKVVEARSKGSCPPFTKIHSPR